MKPDWSSKNVPDWAMYAAQEASGSWYWYSHRPTYSEICTEWQSPGQRQIIPKVELRPQETLEERPPSSSMREDFAMWTSGMKNDWVKKWAERNGCA